jgi:hypothetical protein
MATYTQIGSVTVDAFQWNGVDLVNVPIWAAQLDMQISGTSLCVPMGQRSVVGACPTDWVYQGPDGSINVMTNAQFTALYA